MNLIRRVALAVVGTAILATMAACDPSAGSATYTPAAYYQTIGGVNECYYADDPGEVTDLIQAGLCPANSVATIMPLAWEEEYWDYYSSPAYYDTYMPVRYRSRYTSVTIVHFSRTYSKQISTMSSKAVYKSSAGGTVSGSKVNTKYFGSGSRATKTYGGGSRSGGTSYSGSKSSSRSYGSGSRH